LFYVVKLMLFLLFFVWLFFSSGYLLLRNEEKNLQAAHLGLGILLMYTLAMLFTNIKVALGVQIVLGLIGSLIIRKKTTCAKIPNRVLSNSHYFLWFTLVTAFSFLVIHFPITEWDARSIWFYHGKVIYFTNDIWALGAWKEHAHMFSHLGYPKLFALLAAQAANFFGLWNEYIPKLGLSLLSLPIMLYAFEYANRMKSSGSFFYFMLLLIVLTLFFFDGSGFFLMSGYMDGWLAVYAFCTSLIAADTVREFTLKNNLSRLPSLIVFGALLSQIKQEGMVILAIIITTSFLVNLFSMGGIKSFINKIIHQNLWRELLDMTPFIIIIVISISAWSIGAHIQKISEVRYSGNIVDRLIERWNSPGVPSWIFSNVLFHNSMLTSALLLSFLLMLSSSFLKIKMSFVHFIPFIAGIAYSLILMIVYFITPADVIWQMSCSAGRVGLSASMLIMAFNFLIISESS
jgi:hypothetical protein